MSGAGDFEYVTLTANDGNGNSKSCSFKVTLVDNIPPVLQCPDNQTVGTDETCTNIVGEWFSAVSDECTNSYTEVQSPLSSTALNGVGDYETITLTVTDDSGNTATCTFTVTLNDGLPPTIECPADQTLEANATCDHLLGAWHLISKSDFCTDEANISELQSPPASTNLHGHNAQQVVTLTASDPVGNSAECSFTVTLLDVTPPNLTCAPPVTVEANATGSCNFDLADYRSAAMKGDNCGTVSLTQVPEAQTGYTHGADGTQSVQLIANDGNGNTASCAFTVTIDDVTSPVISACPAGTTVNTTGVSGCQVQISDFSMAAFSATDNCGTPVFDSQSPVAGTYVTGVLHGGTHTVTVTIRDGNGNTGTCTTSVTVNDVTPPTAVCKNITVSLSSTAGNGAASILAGDVNDGSYDNCAVTPTSVTPSSFDCSNVGDNTVTLLVTDSHGLTATCAATVTVNDVDPPVANCPANMTVHTSDDATGNCSTTASFTVPAPGDNCSATSSASPASGSVFGLGSNTVTVTATDGAGNTHSCGFTVTVQDDENPVANCPANMTVAADATCSGIVGVRTAASASDNCGTVTVTQAPLASTVLSGDNDFETVVLTANDGHGNFATCSFTVTLKDVTPPSVLCKTSNINLLLDASGTATVTTALVNNGSSDNCTSVTMSVSPNSLSCANVGNNVVTLTVTDGAGNTSACTANVVIFDFLTYSSEVRKNAADGLAGDKIGKAVSLSGTLGLAGAPEDKVGSNLKQGSATLFNGASNWAQATQLFAPDGLGSDYFGFGLGLDGGTAVVGAYAANIGAIQDQGAAYVFTQSSLTSWPFSQKLVASDGIAYDYFGNAVSVSNSGTRAAIGAYRARIGANTSQGAAYIFDKTSSWSQVKKVTQPATDGAVNQYFGSSVSLANDLVVVGATGNASNRGAAYLFRKDQGGTNNWGQVKKLIPSDAASGDLVGTAVAQSSTNSLVGAPGKNTYAGAAYLFRKDQGGTNNWGQVKKLVASDATANDLFGQSVALQNDYAYVGAVRNSTTGAVYVFQKDYGGTDNWGQIGKYLPTDGGGGDQYGISVAVNANGTSMGVGANLHDLPSKADIGSAYFYSGFKCSSGKPAEETAITDDQHLPNGAAPEVTVYPNPFTSDLTVRISSENAPTLTVTDAAGRVVTQLALPMGEVKFELTTQTWPAGLYFLQVATSSGVRVLPVAKM